MTISTTNGDAPNSPEALTYSAYIKEELRRYDEHLRDVRGLSAGTRKDRLRIIGLLLEGKFKHREVVFTRMQPDDVRQFLATRLAQRQTFSNASQHAAALRSYLRYRATCGDLVAELAAVISIDIYAKVYAAVIRFKECAYTAHVQHGYTGRIKMLEIFLVYECGAAAPVYFYPFSVHGNNRY